LEQVSTAFDDRRVAPGGQVHDSSGDIDAGDGVVIQSGALLTMNSVLIT